MRLSSFSRGGLVLALAVLATAPAQASLFGKKKPAEDFTTTRPLPVAAQPVAPANGSIFQAADGYAALYEGWRARRVGDPLTIVLVERTAASKSANSKLGSKGDLGINPPTTGPLGSLLKSTDIGMGGSRNFNGSGAADQSNSLSGEISVTVAQVFPNGTMLVQGQKRVTLNRGDEFIQIKGLVRMADVGIDNRVPSTRVADAQIAYTGKGDVARASRQGWLSRFFQAVSPF
ncbi:flagellar L-ring family protein [Sphingomonas sp. S17]|jgi:flagellar L-ring protein precursor FlgH|uniref:Flagellar L-ring protein n=2 Tax=Sphingomonas paucimobilis TaxID=13689 RepID=A0A7T3E7I4_SPHPI|nr:MULTISPECIES: flagellar basal body L-ring protein FlgH [Sphingomonas]GAN13594.1 flagellar L-ring protein [Sphingomonas paucimobilis NBRC 13935]EGI54099.1 flagellar L-ring family protein [Sphingomonas sp. S17]MBQ1480321.1 flagellar basal body L-ring protein FlgH [Sphingomonas sp.]MDG5969773.1 flagellar basal body L-ring protein FlgH [Sphingomonas paucimobilis]QBE94078.1 flagellar biosynthesis protein FlgH [Sphingomonas paucimobilis]